ncbi:deoxyribonuclease-2-alpha-like [Rhipicephalus sanguineus]|uniref:deoxyribonuclease-2-alpha-like n=1 Tax=Rhipicephalus sanguineus TaxID=34632 RepID=UPI0020C3EDE6|nr:deoxyribonuclease-2-alpha-like [Rhipicephalus sanguineus]
MIHFIRKNFKQATFIIYKLPHNTLQSFNPSGGKFAYVDERIIENKPSYWQLSEQDLVTTENPVAYTLQPLYEDNLREDILYFAYNDQPPEPYRQKLDGSHSKAKLLRTQSAGVHDNKTTKWMNSYADVKELADNNFLEEYRTLKEPLASKSGHFLWAYAKPAAAGTDLYAGALFGDLGEPIVVQSWRNGPGRNLNTNEEVFDIFYMVLKFGEDNYAAFSATVDHSKWAFTTESDIFCFCSSNRKESQEKRGGEALCFDNDVVKALFCSGVKAAHPHINCNNERKRHRIERERGPA